MSVFEVRWPILDDQLSLRELVGVARREARAIAVRAGVVPAGSWSWRVEGDERLWLVGSVAGVRRGRHREHLLAVNAAAKRRAALVEAPTCVAPGCWHVCGESGACEEHRKLRTYQRRRRMVVAS